MGSNELPSGNLVHEGPAIPLGKKGGFAGTHILVPRGGVAVHINAFNFPIWGLLEKFAPSFLPACRASRSRRRRPATSRSRRAPDRGIGVVARRQPAARHRQHRRSARPAGRPGRRHLHRLGRHRCEAAQPQDIIGRSIPFNAEADSAELRDPRAGRDAGRRGVRPLREGSGARNDREGGPEVHRDPACDRPAAQIDEVAKRLADRLAKVVVGDPSVEGVRMGALASSDQQRDVAERVAQLAAGNEKVYAGGASFAPGRRGRRRGCFLRADPAALPRSAAQHRGARRRGVRPVSTLMPYGDIDEAVALAARGRGSLVATLVTRDPNVAARVIPAAAAMHGRLLVLDRIAAAESDRPRLAVAAIEARRPGPRRRWRGTRRVARRQALPAARRGAGLAEHAHRRHGRIRARRHLARKRRASVPQALRGFSRSAIRC